MTADELDAIYTQLCRATTAVGTANAALFLARFALLAIAEIDDPPRLGSLVDAAAQDLVDDRGGHPHAGFDADR